MNALRAHLEQHARWGAHVTVTPGDIGQPYAIHVGGPVYDAHGNLIAVVTAKMDHNVDPNAENLNFAITAQALTSSAGWSFSGNGQQEFEHFVSAANAVKLQAQQ